MKSPRIVRLVALSSVVLAGCATTTLASSAADPRPETVPTTLPATTTTTTQPATTTEAPTTTSTTTTTKPAPVTTTTVAPEAVPPMDAPIVAVGKSNGHETMRAQWRLLQLGFWVQDATGDYGITTQQAVMAFQKYAGLTADGSIGDETAGALTAATERASGRSDAGTLVEIDKSKQLLFFIVDGATEWVLNVSTGSEIPYDEPNRNKPGERDVGDSVTRTGLWDVYRERPEGWWPGDLGEIYRPKYFTGGIAVHGSGNIPNYPASHGCVRVSVPAMDWIWDSELMPMGTPVWVHGEIPA